MININNNVSGSLNATKGVLEHSPTSSGTGPKASEVSAEKQKSDFSDTVNAVGKYLSKVDDLQQSSDMSIKDLLSGKNEDITSVVSAVAKADMSFKLLVGVRNKLIEAYKQTMNMPL
ncbi:MAG: flagellar hook-basal body complex protein FliE [Planctomycetota bacterium]|jgi:flagellar hook-basal body complex protein FliE